MMGKISSKHVCKRTAPEGECVLVNTKVASVKDLMDAIYSHDCLSEAFVELSGSKQMQEKAASQESPTIELTTDFMSCCGKPDSNGLFDHHLCNIPIRVTLPPLTKESDLLKLLTVDRMQEEGGGSDGIQTDTTDNNHGSEKAELSQDNECGIRVKANTGPELQEWHFTLYDFDDLGKITKEDIAGLLKSLYDTVGSVITLQQQGTRVLKLHLTVSPDQEVKCPPAHGTKGNSCAVQDHKSAEGTKSNNSAFRSVAAGVLSSCNRPSRPTRCALVHHGSPRTPHHKTMPERRPVCSRDKRPDLNSSERKEGNDLLLTRRLSFCGGQGLSDAAAAAAAAAVGTTTGTSIHRRQQQSSGSASKRLSQLDERHLTHLIQQNMSLNDHYPQHSRRNRRRHSIFFNKIQVQDHSSADRTHTNDANGHPNKESAQCGNYYLDLANIENYTTSKTCELTSSTRPSCGTTGAEKGMQSQKSAKFKSKITSSACKNSEHCSSARTGALGTDTICKQDETATSNVFMAARQESRHSGSPPLNLKFPATVNMSQSNPSPNDVETVSSSHYRRRHRHREKNQSRAMKQVAEWIEKEQIYQKSEKRVVVVQRHEHHHVHEHFHHHFHHCSHI